MRVEIDPGDRLEIAIKGYGDKVTQNGFGSPVYLEQDDDGKMCLYVWADITQEDPTHKICLEGARESRREAHRPQDVCPQCGDAVLEDEGDMVGCPACGCGYRNATFYEQIDQVVKRTNPRPPR